MTYQEISDLVQKKVSSNRWGSLSALEKIQYIYDIGISVAKKTDIYRLPLEYSELSSGEYNSEIGYISFLLPDDLFKFRKDLGIATVILDNKRTFESNKAVPIEVLEVVARNENFTDYVFSYDINANRIFTVNAVAAKINHFKTPSRTPQIGDDHFLSDEDVILLAEIVASYFSAESGDSVGSQQHMAFAQMYLDNDNS